MEKIRIKELKIGDTFKMRQVIFQVKKITDTSIIFYCSRYNNTSVFGYAFHRGKNSNEFVWLLPVIVMEAPKTFTRPKAEYSNIGHWSLSEAI